MLYSLGDPLSLIILLVGFVLAVTVHGTVQSLVAARLGARGLAGEGRTKPDPRVHVDPFGAVAGLIAGVGWAKPVEPPDRRRRGVMVAVLLSGAVATIVLGLLLLAGFRLSAGPIPGVGRGWIAVLQYGVDGGSLGQRALLLTGLSLLFFGVLALVPLPPLPGGRLLFGLAPRTSGWQKAEYQLVERNIGIAVLLALLLIPLGGPQALLPTLLDTLVGPVVALVTGA